jgi:hypothetical protein
MKNREIIGNEIFALIFEFSRTFNIQNKNIFLLYTNPSGRIEHQNFGPKYVS